MVVSSIRDILATARAPGYELEVASDDRTALLMLAEASFDLLIADLVLTATRMETLRTVRRLYPTLPIVAMAGAQNGDASIDYVAILPTGPNE